MQRKSPAQTAAGSRKHQEFSGASSRSDGECCDCGKWSLPALTHSPQPRSAHPGAGPTQAGYGGGQPLLYQDTDDSLQICVFLNTEKRQNKRRGAKEKGVDKPRAAKNTPAIKSIQRGKF